MLAHEENFIEIRKFYEKKRKTTIEIDTTGCRFDEVY